MRILRIAMRNLNSLKGEHVLDFTTSPLADHPLYAIVGPTGSGKTTILDAITLALYGQTERTKDIVDAKSEVATVMTHGTARCRAEVEYETAAGRYRNVWRRRRAHGKVGKALQPSEREIGKWNEREQTYDILATKKSEVGPLTVEVTGLTYDRFIRSVMLTQGDFDRFLKSNAGEKSEILEQITGTEIYRDLSMAAFERHKLARETYSTATEKLNHGLPLPEEERLRLDEAIQHTTDEVDSLRTQLALFTSQLAAYDTAERRREEYERALQQQRTIAGEWEDLSPQRQQLAQSEALAPVGEDLAAHHRLSSEIAATKDEAALVDKLVQRAEAAFVDSQTLTQTAREELARFRDREPEREQRLCEAELLEQEIRSLRQAGAQLDSQLALHLRTRQKIEAAVAENAQAVNQLNAQLAGRSPQQVATETERLERQLPELEASLSDSAQAITYQKLTGKIAAQTAESHRVEQELNRVSERRKRADAEAEAAGKQVDIYQLKQQNEKLRASLEAHRSDLKDGAPCPLCGALHHPYREGQLPLPEAGELERQLNQAQIRATELDNEALKIARQQRELERQLDTTTARLSELGEQRAGLPPPIPGELPQLLEQHEKVNRQLATTRQTLEQLRRLRPLLPELRGREVALAQAREQLSEVTAAVADTEKQLASVQTKLTTQRNKLTTLIGETTAAECRKAATQQLAHLQRTVDQRSQEEQQRATESATARTRLGLLTERQEQRTRELQAVSQRLLNELSPLELTIEEATARLLPPARAEALRQQLRQTEQEQLKITALLTRIATEVEQARQALTRLPERPRVKEALEDAQRSLSAAEQRIGALRERQAEDEKKKEQTEQLRQELTLLEKERDRWARMNELIGSANGKKFQSFAQGITLQRLVSIGNRHLETINPRYRMVYAPPAPGDKETLELEIIDTYMNDNRRTMATLSGGESFLISLALALGLSDLASGKQLIQSLFIDEGFGTLDDKTLDQAMITLEQLQAQGKTIGIISHVQQLRERIHCQIQLEPVGDGFSRIEVVS